MKILIDHGSIYNLGDTAMLEGAVARLRDVLPAAELSIINKADLRTDLWSLPNIYKQEDYRVEIPIFDLFDNIPFFWRYRRYYRKSIANLALAFFKKHLINKHIALGDKFEAKNSLDEFCDPFDALFITGGGNLTDVFQYNLFQKCCLMLAFIRQGKPVILTGQQLGPFDSYLSKKNLSEILKKVNFIGLREPGYSLDFCKHADINPKRFKVMGDDSFGTAPADELLVADILNNNNLKAYEFLAINIRLGFYNRKINAHLKKIAILFRELGKRLQMPIVFVPISFNMGDDNDEVSSKRLVNLMDYPNVKILKYPNPSPSLTKGVLSKAFGAVGVSYHFCTFALSAGVPAVSIYDGSYYSQKSKGICSFWGDDQLTIPIGKVDNLDFVIASIINLFQDNSFRERLQSKAKKFIEHWQTIFDKRIKDILKGNIQ